MMKTIFASFLVVIGAMTFVTPAHARWGGPKLVSHSFGFDAVADSPDIQVTDYRYGTSAAPGASMPEWVKRDVGVAGGTSTTGPMIVGDELYVQWRIRATGEVLEDTVDLARLRAEGRMPSKITDHTLYFVVNGRQLEVYLVTPNPRDPAAPIVGPPKFRMTEVIKLYPETN